MALDTNIGLTGVKAEALLSIMNSMSINYPDMKSKLTNFTRTSPTFDSLLGLYSTNFNRLSSSDINGAMLLSYLDFYTLYIILYANVSPIKNLMSITENKMSYIMSIYRDVDSVTKEKELQKVNKYVFYTNFFNPKDIDLSISKVYLLRDKLSDALSTVGALTLPIELTKEIPVVSISSRDTDSYYNIIENNNTKNTIDYSVNRKGFNKIGIADFVAPLKQNNIYNGSPKVTGTIHGYFSENISVVVSGVIYNTNGSLSGITLIGSSDNLVWSDNTFIPAGVMTEFLIDNQFNVGLSIQFEANNKIETGDSWKINLRYISIDNPELISAIKFMSLEKMSFLTWNDLSKDELEFIGHKVKYRREEKFVNLDSKIFTNGINSIVPIFKGINDYEITVKQNSYDVKQIDSELTHSFSFNISDIKGIYNQYKAYGITSFKKIDIKQESPILSVGILTDSYIPNPDKQFIEHSLIVTFGKSVLFLPVLSDDNDGVLEYFVPELATNGAAKHITRFPVDPTVEVIVTNITDGIVTSCTMENINVNINNTLNQKKMISISDYNLRATYQISYKPLVNSFLETTVYELNGDNSWMYNNSLHFSDIYYMYYKDFNNKNRIALCTRDMTDMLTPFYGSIAGIVEMRSLDQGYLSPTIFEYKLIAN